MTAPKRKLTSEEFYELYKDEPYELIDGEAVLKTSHLEEAGPLPSHALPATCLGTWIHRRFDRQRGGRWPGGWRIVLESDVRYRDDRVFCHDLVGWQRERLEGVPVESWGKLVRPDWVGEVLSPGHKQRDLVVKMNALHAAGVPYYWVIDRDERVLFPYRHEPDGYLLVHAVASGQTIRAEPFDAVELRTGIIFGDEDDDE